LLIIVPPPSSAAVVVVVSSGEVLDDIPVIRQCSSRAFLAIERIANF
jgi:DNA-directed RNA polymerase subunit N (RpoN/RPB10)